MHDLSGRADFDLAGAILTIDLAAIRENYRRLRARLARAACAAVVKADGYGLGAIEVAKALRKEGCRTFFVAHGSEGIALREALGPEPEIVVLNGIHPGGEDRSAAAGLVAVANSLAQLAAWRETAGRLGRKLPVIIQVDSGMSRLGMSRGEVGDVAAANALDGLELRAVISHLACADTPEDPANESQRRAFAELTALLPPAPASLANSSGIFIGEAYHGDLVRPGAALYGINPTPGHPNPMLPAVTLQAKVIQTRSLEAGAGVGYAHTFRASAPLEVATIALGYADGWPRHVAASAWCDGVELPFAGRVSMDSIVIDISALPRGRLKPGDLVELIGAGQDVDDIAARAGTIGYEILTGLGRRFNRRYQGA
jgi:alanine racemase